MIHSLVVNIVGVGMPDPDAIMVMLDMFGALIARVGGAGAMAAGEPVEDGVDTAGEAMSATCENLYCRGVYNLGFTIDQKIRIDCCTKAGTGVKAC
jgi:hypothetical protein